MDAARIKYWKDKANRSTFFFMAVFFHLLIFLMAATYVFFKAPVPPREDFGKVFVPQGVPPPPPPPPSTPTVSVSPAVVPLTAAIVSQSALPAFSVPMPDLTTPTDQNATHTPAHVAAPPSNSISPERLTSIKSTVKSWRSDNIADTAGDVNAVVAKFPIFLAKYADGDWKCNNYETKGDIILAGCLPNLVNKMSEWSMGKITGLPPKIIAIDSPELISTPPPFIFFTGHRDFHLTDSEIDNLRKYIQVGGAVWGDSAFSGSGSRFDVAFHREMKRVLPDEDKNFEPLPLDHKIFNKSKFPIAKLPLGMNYRQDPIEIINVDGKLAVLYTPNDYSDMMTMDLKPGVEEDSAQFTGPTHYSVKHPLYSTHAFVSRRAVYFRNFEPGPGVSSFKLCMNIVGHLLVRFDDVLLLTP